MIRSRKKSRKLRGRSRTMGWGQVGQHRKAGSKGGIGAVGYHKHKWSYLMKYAKDWYGKRGFKSPKQITAGVVRAVNVGLLSRMLDTLVAEGKARRVGEMYEVDITALGYEKLLGGGEVAQPLRIIAVKASRKAIEKVKQAGGEVVVLEKAD